jgi:hypothetical protein
MCVYICYCGKRLSAAGIWFKFRQNVNNCRFVLKCTCQSICCGYVELFLVVLDSPTVKVICMFHSPLTNKNISRWQVRKIIWGLIICLYTHFRMEYTHLSDPFFEILLCVTLMATCCWCLQKVLSHPYRKPVKSNTWGSMQTCSLMSLMSPYLQY